MQMDARDNNPFFVGMGVQTFGQFFKKSTILGNRFYISLGIVDKILH
jgi:hypothetical protein